MDIFYFLIGFFVSFIVLLDRELLIKKNSFKLILGAAVVLFLGGVILHFTAIGRYTASGALLCPLVSLLLFRLFRRHFLTRYGREPRDTFLNWESGMGADRVFNIVYFVSTGWLVMLGTIAMQELAKAGW